MPRRDASGSESNVGRDAALDTQWRSGALVALRLTVLLVLVCGVGYPALLYGAARLAFPSQAEGSLLHDQCGRVIGSLLIGQLFEAPQYFHGRPSAVAYNAGSSGGSNLGSTNPVLADSLAARAIAFREANALARDRSLPPDVVTASGSGIDPHVSPEMANLQATRVRRARTRDRGVSFSAEQLQELIAAHTLTRQAGILGEPRVNVLELNLALDSLDSNAPIHFGCVPAATGAQR